MINRIKMCFFSILVYFIYICDNTCCLSFACDVMDNFHYENTSMQHTAIFHGCKNGNFQLIVFDNFHIFAQNIDCWYTLEPPQSMF